LLINLMASNGVVESQNSVKSKVSLPRKLYPIREHGRFVRVDVERALRAVQQATHREPEQYAMMIKYAVVSSNFDERPPPTANCKREGSADCETIKKRAID
jgi:hypothetical protein